MSALTEQQKVDIVLILKAIEGIKRKLLEFLKKK